MGICIINMGPKNIYYPLGKGSFIDIFGVGVSLVNLCQFTWVCLTYDTLFHPFSHEKLYGTMVASV